MLTPSTTHASKKIWYYKEMDSTLVEINPKFQPTGNFYEDIKKYCEEANIAVHPSFQEPDPVIESDIDRIKATEEGKKEETKKEEVKPKKELPKYLCCYSRKMDKTSIKALSVILPTSKIEILKLSNNDFTITNFILFVDALTNSNIHSLFIDWNPVKNDNATCANFSKILDNPKIANLYLRSNDIDDETLDQIAKKLKISTTLITLDVSKNRLTAKSILSLCDALERNRTLQFLGLQMNKLNTCDVLPLLNVLGNEPFPPENVDEQNKKINERNAIIEKNKKSKGKKEEVPFVDSIVQIDGKWFIQKNTEIKMINLDLNNFDEKIQEYVTKMLSKTPETFKLTVSSKDISKEKQKDYSEFKNRLIIQ